VWGYTGKKPAKSPDKKGAEKLENYATASLYDASAEDAIYCKANAQPLPKNDQSKYGL
jgi:hypothetical protein